ncbi:MAG: hypothetical protein WDW36_004043 [Sanguina aurantia]
MVSATAAGVGSWTSPITSELITSSSIRLGSPALQPSEASAAAALFWLEGRPAEAGRVSVVRSATDGSVTNITPAPDSGFNVRTTVHEYGGGEYLVTEEFVVFVNFKDQRLYKQTLSAPEAPPVALTPAGRGLRFADMCWDEGKQRLVCVCEAHTEGHPVQNSIVAVGINGGEVVTLASGHDFFSSPRLSADGSRLSYLSWDFPQMPWDGTELWVAAVREDGTLEGCSMPAVKLAVGLSDTARSTGLVLDPIPCLAGSATESCQQPQWDPSGPGLYFISDATDWWNLYHWSGAPGQAPTKVFTKAADFGFPMWTFGLSSYCVFKGGEILALYSDPARAGTSLGVLTPDSNKAHALTRLETGFSSMSSLRVAESSSGGFTVAAAAATPMTSSAIVRLTAASVQDLVGRHGNSRWEVVKSSSSLDTPLDPGYISVPEAVEFPTTDGKTAFMNYYPPQNKDFVYPEGVKPPLLVKIHGGPTGSAAVLLNLTVQYWTSRGWAIADVNYGGSTGYGRQYRNRLLGNWGVVDVDDCANAAAHLARQGLVDPAKLCIDGGSAGGYTTLACLAFRDTFAAGASFYGVADMELLAKDTHKFESRYLDMLVGPYPEAKELYVKRSPIHYPQNFRSPIIFFQGDEDKVVPPAQATDMHAAIKAAGVPTALVMFEGEQHGFRKPLSIRTSLDGELYFYGKALGFPTTMPPGLQPILIDNAPAEST